jgi:hypothetical protein
MNDAGPWALLIDWPAAEIFTESDVMPEAADELPLLSPLLDAVRSAINWAA